VDEFKASRTALATSLMRAVHTRLDPHPLIDDSWGDRLVPDSARELFRESALARMGIEAREKALTSPENIVDESLLRSRAYANVVTRTRYAEDALQAAVAKGITQYVLIGAGFDSFALRRPGFAEGVQIFEIDFPSTQDLKLQRIHECGLARPASAHFIAADLSKESVQDALARSSFRSDRLSFFSWLGVSMYLTREANFSTFKSIAACAPKDSELVFTYFDERLFHLPSESFREMERRVASLGEPFLSGFSPATLAENLADCGLTLMEDLDGSGVAARYDRTGARSLGQSTFSHIALARVGV
jgi:methyltransferase (TIGR00027 family)